MVQNPQTRPKVEPIVRLFLIIFLVIAGLCSYGVYDVLSKASYNWWYVLAAISGIWLLYFVLLGKVVFSWDEYDWGITIILLPIVVSVIAGTIDVMNTAGHVWYAIFVVVLVEFALYIGFVYWVLPELTSGLEWVITRIKGQS